MTQCRTALPWHLSRLTAWCELFVQHIATLLAATIHGQHDTPELHATKTGLLPLLLLLSLLLLLLSLLLLSLLLLLQVQAQPASGQGCHAAHGGGGGAQDHADESSEQRKRTAEIEAPGGQC
jgi:hypothetical protein